MKTLELDKALKQFDVFFAAARHSMFKAEVLQDYSAIDDGPSLQAWLRGDKAHSLMLAKQNPDYNSWINECLNSPANITLVHAVVYPLTDYLQWETAIYRSILVPSGAQHVLLADKSKLGSQHLPDGDFWIFDNQRVVKFNYHGPKGECVGGTIFDATDDITHFVKARQALFNVAKPVSVSD